MIFNPNTKDFQTRRDKPNSNWTNDDSYIVISDNSYLSDKIQSLYPNFECVFDEEGNFIDVEEIVDIDSLKDDKIQELEIHINNLKENGFEYKNKPFKLDDLAQERINKLATAVALGQEIDNLQWITRNGEEGIYTISDTLDFKTFYIAATTKIMEIEQLEAYKKLEIEQTTTKEELDNIIFE